MAQVFNTGGPKGTGRGVGVSEREDLSAVISRISREETPFLSSIGKTKATAIYHEWQVDELSAPKSSAVAEGASFDAVSAAQGDTPFRARLGNYSQINSKTITVSGTKRAVDQAGVKDEYAFQMEKRGIEMKRDVEFDLVHSNNSSSAGGTISATGTYPSQFAQATVRKFGGYQAFVNYAGVTAGTQLYGIAGPSNVVGPNGETPDSTTGVLQIAGTTTWTAPTVQGNGTAGTFVGNVQSSLQLAAVDTVMQNIYQNGGKATKLMTSPSNKKAFSARAQAAGSNVRRNIDESGKLRQNVEFYMSDFGDIQVVPNYIMGLASTGVAATDAQDYFAFVYDPQWFAMASLRPTHEVDLGQVGDSINGQIIEEQSFQCTNAKGSGMIVGLSGT